MLYRDRATLRVENQISSNLSFRHSADALFEYINGLDISSVVVDFSGVESITRSFAHQYVMNKMQSQKEIIECDMPVEIKPMFELVERQRVAAQDGHKLP